MTSFRLKHFLERNGGGCWGDDPTGIDDTVVLRSTEQSSDGEWRITDPAVRHISASERKSKTIELDDIIITKSSGSTDHIGKASIADQTVAELEAVYSNFMQRIRINSRASPKYVWHLLNSFFARYHYNIYANSTSGLGNLNSRIVGNLLFPIPDLLTQQAIADFLDCETARIDSLIKKKQRLVELLGEKRNVLITTAVTGNNPNKPENSGGRNRRSVKGGGGSDIKLRYREVKKRLIVENEFPHIPDDWGVERLRFLFTESKERNGKIPVGEMLSVSEYHGVVPRDYEDEDQERTDEELENYRVVRPGQLAVNSMWLNHLGLGVSEHTGHVSPAYNVYNISERLDRRFIHHLLRSKYYLKIYLRYLYGIRPNSFQIKSNDWASIPILIPDISTQRVIADFLDRETARIDKIIERTRVSIDRLKEYRSALITAAVTGQINVSTYARSKTTDRLLDAIQSEIQA